MSTQADAVKIIELIMAQDLGFSFTQNAIQLLCAKAGYNFSHGAISGTISRAMGKGLLEVSHKVRVGRLNKQANVYKIVEKGDWDHKPKSHGSYPGRESNTVEKIDIAYLGNEIPGIQVEHTENATFGSFSPESLNGLPYMEPKKKEIDLTATFPIGSIGHQLLVLAVEVNDLEFHPVKTLKDYTTDELLDEIKKRVRNV